jgi:GDPmannose 4,6-dehydratase
VDILLGNAERARTKIGWEPDFSINELVEDMVKSDCGELNFE